MYIYILFTLKALGLNLSYTAEFSDYKTFEINYVIYHIRVLGHVRVTIHIIWKHRPMCRI